MYPKLLRVQLVSGSLLSSYCGQLMYVNINIECMQIMYADNVCIWLKTLRDSMEQPSAKQRKRDAVGSLREFAAELGVPRFAACSVLCRVVATAGSLLSLLKSWRRQAEEGKGSHQTSSWATV